MIEGPPAGTVRPNTTSSPGTGAITTSTRSTGKRPYTVSSARAVALTHRSIAASSAARAPPRIATSIRPPVAATRRSVKRPNTVYPAAPRSRATSR
jgi:hypothetical protein